jgi:hypothetical protein
VCGPWHVAPPYRRRHVPQEEYTVSMKWKVMRRITCARLMARRSGGSDRKVMSNSRTTRISSPSIIAHIARYTCEGEAAHAACAATSRSYTDIVTTSSVSRTRSGKKGRSLLSTNTYQDNACTCRQ